MQTNLNQVRPLDNPPDAAALRKQAIHNMQDGAVTEGYSADREKVLQLLNEALATEIVCVLRYRRHYFMARGIKARIAAEEFMEHATEELGHADRIAERIVQLGGEPNFDPKGMLERSHSQYAAGSSLEEMIRENLIAERIAIDSYRGMVQLLSDNDPTTRRMLEEILASEEEHADDLADLLE